jgi:hypothetical protein
VIETGLPVVGTAKLGVALDAATVYVVREAFGTVVVAYAFCTVTIASVATSPAARTATGLAKFVLI